MTTKFLGMQKISIRPQNDTEKILLTNIGALIRTGKEAIISFNDTDLILEIKSKK